MNEVSETEKTVPPAPTYSLREYAQNWVVGLRSGELGSLPIAVGLVLVGVIFQSLNSNFLTANNLVNLMVQGAAMATMAMGMVFVLLIGEIDLSIGYVSGVVGVLTALMLTPDGSVDRRTPWAANHKTKDPVLRGNPRRAVGLERRCTAAYREPWFHNHPERSGDQSCQFLSNSGALVGDPSSLHSCLLCSPHCPPP
jgi:hypothetical protein